MSTDNLLEISTAIVVALAVLGIPLIWLVDRATRRRARPPIEVVQRIPTRTRSVRGNASGNAVAMIAGWFVAISVLVLSQQSLILSVPIVIALTASLVVTTVMVYRSAENLRSVPTAAALAVAGLLALTVMAWGARFEEPQLIQEVRIASAAATEYDALSARRADSAERKQNAVDLVDRLTAQKSAADKRLNETMAASDAAERALTCEFDGTCGTGVPGVGEAYSQKREVRDRALEEYANARKSSERISAELALAQAELTGAAKALLDDSSRLRAVDAGEEPLSSHNALFVQFRVLLTAPWSALIAVIAGAAVMVLVRRRSHSPGPNVTAYEADYLIPLRGSGSQRE